MTARVLWLGALALASVLLLPVASSAAVAQTGNATNSGRNTNTTLGTWVFSGEAGYSVTQGMSRVYSLGNASLDITLTRSTNYIDATVPYEKTLWETDGAGNIVGSAWSQSYGGITIPVAGITIEDGPNQVSILGSHRLIYMVKTTGDQGTPVTVTKSTAEF